MKKKECDKIRYHYLTKPFYFPNRRELKNFILDSLKDVGKEIEAINYIFCDDNFLLQINKKYLRHSTLTDIITFELSDKNSPLLSDIYISIQRIKENALKFQVPFSTELLRVIFHGILHLIGYSDKTRQQALQIRLKENEYLNDFAISRGTNKKANINKFPVKR